MDYPSVPINVYVFIETLPLTFYDFVSALNFLPLSLVQNPKFASLPNWLARDHHDQADGELKECCGKVFIDSAPEFLTPMKNIVDFSEIDIILISNFLNMLTVSYITEGTNATEST